MTSRHNASRSPILAYAALRKQVDHSAPLPNGYHGEFWKLEAYMVIREMQGKGLAGRVLDRTFTFPAGQGVVSWLSLQTKPSTCLQC